MVMPVVRCDVCGFGSGLSRLRVLWTQLHDPTMRGGVGEYVLCPQCRSGVLDALQPKVTRSARA